MRKNYYLIKKAHQKFLNEVYGDELSEVTQSGIECNSAPTQSLEVESDSSGNNCQLMNQAPDEVGIASNCSESHSPELPSYYHDHSESATDNKDDRACDSFPTDLKVWAIKNNITHLALKELLKILHPYHSGLPLDPRTLLQTKSLNIERLPFGEYIYLGIEENLRKHLTFDLNSIDTIKLDVNIDGLQVFKSRNTSFWPILVSCENTIGYNYNAICPFIVAIYYGSRKPEISHFLSDFCNELKKIMDEGIQVNEMKLKVELRCIIADAPAKSYLKQIKSHGGYYACDRCQVKGIYKFHSMSYENTEADKRDDLSFRNKTQPEHHIGTSPLTCLNIDIVNVFVIDYMHSILLGIVRRIVNCFINKVPYKMSSYQKHILEDRIKNIKTYIPRDFNRTPRSFNELDRFKATEFLQIIMYTGFLIFKDIIRSDMYDNFLTLMFIVRILNDQVYVSDAQMLEYARKLCVTFIRQYKRIYNTMTVSYNVHSLLHIVDDVERLGVLNSFSAFPYETCLGAIRRRLRSSNAPLAQLTRRISEGFIFKKKIKNINFNVNGHEVIPKDFKNSIVLLKNKSFLSIQSVDNENITGNKLEKLKPAVKFPGNSEMLDIFVVRRTKVTRIVKICDVLKKCIILPYKANYVVLPLL